MEQKQDIQIELENSALQSKISVKVKGGVAKPRHTK